MHKKLTVLQLVPELNIGGVERGTIELALYLKKMGFRSIVVSGGGVWQKELDKAGVEHILMPVGKKSLTALFCIRKLKKLFFELKVDIVHARSRLPAWLSYLAIKKIHNRPKFVTTVHGLYSVKRYSAIMSKGDAVIAVSQTAADYVKKNYANYLLAEPIVIYRGVDANDFNRDFQVSQDWLENWYQQYPLTQNKRMVLLPGRLTALKGAESVVTWLMKTKTGHLILTAEKDQTTYTRQLYDLFDSHNLLDKVSWVGLHHNIKSLYTICDLTLSVNSRPESFGRTVLESLYMGTPVVAYELGGVAEIMQIIQPEGLVRAQDQIQLADKIESFLKIPPIIALTDYFSKRQMLEQTIDVYHDLLKVI